MADLASVDWVHYGLDALVLGVGELLRRAFGRLDRIENDSEETGKDVIHISSHLQDATGYKPRR